MIEYYGMDGQALSRDEYYEQYGDGPEKRRVAETTLPGGVWISTVLLGLDHNFMGSGRPIIFETMVFAPPFTPPNAGDLGPDLDCDRYCTKEEARLGHEAMVTKWTGWSRGEPHPGEEDQ